MDFTGLDLSSISIPAIGGIVTGPAAVLEKVAGKFGLRGSCRRGRLALTTPQVEVLRAAMEAQANPPNPYEEANRAKRVLAICLLVPAGESREANARAADLMAGWGEEERARFAAKAGCKRAPSEKTWAAVVEAVRGRPVESEILDRVFGGAGGGR